MRISASEIFRDNGNDTVTITQPVRIGGVSLSGGVTFSRGVKVGNIELVNLARRFLEARQDNGVYVITDYYE